MSCLILVVIWISIDKYTSRIRIFRFLLAYFVRKAQRKLGFFVSVASINSINDAVDLCDINPNFKF